MTLFSKKQLSNLHKKEPLVIAQTIISSFNSIIKSTRHASPDVFLAKLTKEKEFIFDTIHGEPLMKNAVTFLFNDLRHKSFESLKKELLIRTTYLKQYLDGVYNNIAEYGYKKIKRGMCVYTHNYSESVLHLLLKAKKSGTNFEVHITETRPCLGGRNMATVLSKNNIPVTYYTDAAVRLALKKSDIVLLGADTISEQGQVYGAIGSEMVAELAEKYDVPVYICMASWKYNPSRIHEYEGTAELQPMKELWSNPPKGVIVANYGYEKINPKLVTGVISELGIHKPLFLIAELKKQHVWL
ncbi:MAG TPA: hypothetical protein VKE88_02040 [Candidatus Nanoarchaeia archaeon]|nr:hypothetical protein [Candidatus Nanoarchaeia archaeon]